MRLYFLLACLLVVLSLPVVYQWGRPLWHPLYLRVAGKNTVEKVLTRYEEAVQGRLEAELERQGVDGYPEQLMLLAVKNDKVLEMWGGYKGEDYLIKRYPFTGFSGDLGPKLKRGDGQIPEGLYGVEYLNPNSRFHLSLKVSYPNAFDKERGDRDGRGDLGDDIMIHGKRATIGCIPIGDSGIEEVFVWVARVGREHTRILISPVDFRKGEPAPEIDGIDWERELYAELKQEMLRFDRSGGD